MEEDLYCKIYVDSCSERSELLDFIAKAIKGHISLRAVENELLEITVFKNDEFDQDKTAEADGFVYFPYYLEIEPIDESHVTKEDYKYLVGNFLKALWEAKLGAVAACDFENELPKKVA